ncbi:unnamed protein product [Rotaria sp. Silwood1]|nr:unnamed protein product [Rotaria sp. Silwood1]CAF4767323.1 unnamed protein product [Rotaria sp. Silwood1]
MKKAATVLLRELLDLLATERAILDELLKDSSTANDTAETLSKRNTLDNQQLLFFRSEHSKKVNIPVVGYRDFDNRDALLNTLKTAETTQMDAILRSHVSLKDIHLQTNSSNEIEAERLVLTNTALENVSKILEVLGNPIPTLLEGSTGVGKSASIIEAAKQCNRRLLRLNMSSRITIDDLLGKVKLIANEKNPFEFEKGQFTQAFENGYWILLDELNLAQDTVLQAIESALDTRRLILRDSSSAEQAILILSMHENFRLFATQNPSSGFFKGKREKLSASFLSRFRPITFKELPEHEWCEIVRNRLKKYIPDEAEAYAELMVNRFHMKLREEYNRPDKASLEIGPYTEITIRELLKWVDIFIWQKNNSSWPSDASERSALLSFSAWCIYGARCRESGRTLIERLLTDKSKCGWGFRSLTEIQITTNPKENRLMFDDVSCSIPANIRIFNPQKEWQRIVDSQDLDCPSSFNQLAWDSAIHVHTKIHQSLFDREFILAHGIYRVNVTWLWEWLKSAVRTQCLAHEKEFAVYGCRMYQSRFRHEKARGIIRQCFKEVFPRIDFTTITVEPLSILPEIPYVLTNRVIATLKQVCFNQRTRQPILLTGTEGCGKSELLLMLAWLCDQSIEQLNITPETEPSALIGQIIPNDRENANDPRDPNNGKKLIWEHGCVSRAFIDGHWVLLDNLNVAESSVLERLNPILEQIPDLTLAENCETDRRPMHENYQLVATMTPPNSRLQSSQATSNELSPALYNRFAVVHMPDISFQLNDQSSELLEFIKILLSDEPETDHALTVRFCGMILQCYKENPKCFPQLTLRNFIRLFDSAYRFRMKFNSELNFRSSLWTAYQVTIANQIKNETIQKQLSENIQSLLTNERKAGQLRQPNFLEWMKKNDNYVLTPSREAYANAVLGAVACNIPLLLEGPAAVGKTALIADLCENLKPRTINPSSDGPIKLERVNNSDTTTVQDYLGTYLPMNESFVFQKGTLFRAMENGWWFLADEFNLADPSVMSMLFPLLEGKNQIVIPSTGKVIIAKEGFQFFATQNDASYANRHALPVSLRNRFLEVQFDEFPKEELAEIIARRKDKSHQEPIEMKRETSVYLAKFYHQVVASRLRITFRELVKWIHRHAIFSPKKEIWPIIGASLLGAKYPLKSPIREELFNLFKSVWSNSTPSIESTAQIKQIGDAVQISEGALNHTIPNMKLDGSCVLTAPEPFQRALVRLAFAAQAHEPVLLVGPTSCKTLLIETWAHLIQRSSDLIKVHLTQDTEAGDLIGEIQPSSFLDLLKRLPAMIEQVCRRFEILCQEKYNTNISDHDEIFLAEIRQNDIPILTRFIEQFESAYSQEQEFLAQKEENQANLDAIVAQTYALHRQATIDTIKIPDQEIILEYPRDDPQLTPLPTDYDDDGVPEYDNDYQPTGYLSSNFQSSSSSDRIYHHTISISDHDDATYDLDDDGMFLSNSAMESTISTMQTTTCELNDGMDESTAVTDSAEAYELNDGMDDTIQDSTDGYLPDDGMEESSTNDTSEMAGEHVESENNLDNGQSQPATTKHYQSKRKIQYPQELLDVMMKILNDFQMKFTPDDEVCADKTLQDYYRKLKKTWQTLTANDLNHTKPIFIFKDGPVTTAAKRGCILVLEDLDLSSQAVIERLNSMLEPSPTFALTEDITCQTDQGQLDVVLSNQFQIFATVHQDQIHQVLRLSPATRSRFTEIYVNGYSDDDLRKLAEIELVKLDTSLESVKSLIKMMFSLREIVVTDPEWKMKVDIRLLFRWTDFILHHPSAISVEQRMFLGARFFYFDQLPMLRHISLFEQWLKTMPSSTNTYEAYKHIFEPPNDSHGTASLKIRNLDDRTIYFPFILGKDYIGLRYTGVMCRYQFETEEDESQKLEALKSRFLSVPTATFLNQMARIFAATASKTPLLLEGPPGIGKTHVVKQVCGLLNKEYERINMSANTTLDQLIGCIIPRVINGVRTFQWQQGLVLSAIRAKKWILLDELNLASPEVLEGLTPLFYRGVTQYMIPNSGELVDMKDVLIFATMNPSTICGGRTKLPRSISNLFTIVQLEEYSTEELRLILNGEFTRELAQGKINMDHLDAVFAMHMFLKKMVDDGQLGRVGGPYELNLRDLAKFHDVFQHSIDSQISHYRYFNVTDDSTETKSDQKAAAFGNNHSIPSQSMIDDSDPRILPIRKFAQVVYACQFQGEEDFHQVCNIIKNQFPINKTLEKREDDSTIDDTVASIVRIGSVYINKGSLLSSNNDIELIHTKKTIRQLELLASACQSKRAILLEGGICSRKSTLVMELARLTRNRLLILPLHENFETADLIGSWLPTTKLARENPIFARIDQMYKQLTKFLLLLIMPSLPEENKTKFVDFKNILQCRTSIKEKQRMELLEEEVNGLQKTVDLLDHISQIATISKELKLHLLSFITQLYYFQEKLGELRGNMLGNQEKIAFEFVESEFVRAIREGWWVLLDNVNSAPSEVIERLNSLMEENPMLTLYENSEGKKLERGAGIHENFRLFATANINRVYSNRLSSAFLNRVIRIWLPMIDDVDLKRDLRESDLYELVSQQLSQIPAGKQLAHLLVLTHITVKTAVQENRLKYPTDFSITYRLLEQSVQTMLSLIERSIHPVDACYWSILRSYCSSLENDEQYRSFVHQLQRTIKEVNLTQSTTIFSSPSDELDRQKPIWYQQSQMIRSAMVQFEEYFLEFIFTAIHIVLQDQTFLKNAVDLLKLFIDHLLIPLQPNDILLVQIKQNLFNQTPTSEEFPRILTELSQKHNLTMRFNLSEVKSVTYSIDQLINDLKTLFRSIFEQLNEDLEKFIANTSLKDHSERLDFLRRVTSIIETFERFFSDPIFVSFDSQTSLFQFSSQSLQIIRPLLKLKNKSRSFELFEDAAFLDVKEKFRNHLYQHFDASLIWSFERVQNDPIRSSRKDLRQLVSYMVKGDRPRAIVSPIEHYATILEWISLQWTLDDYLLDSVRHVLQRNVTLSVEFIEECELKSSCMELIYQLSKLLVEMVKGLPAESTSVNTKFQQAELNLTAKEKELGKKREELKKFEEHLARNAKIQTSQPRPRPPMIREASVFHPDGLHSPSEHDGLGAAVNQLELMVKSAKEELNQRQIEREKVIERAIAARQKLEEGLEKLLKSAAYQYIQHRFIQPNNKHFQIFFQALSQARLNPSLVNSDHLLDFRAVLGTSFGQQWLENAHLFDTPLTYFLCGFYFLPDFPSNLNFQILSNWNQFEDQIDLRRCSSDVWIFLCPNKEDGQCCLLNIENDVRSCVVHCWTLEGSLINDELEKILEKLFSKTFTYRIDQHQLPSVDNVTLDHSLHKFALASLVHFRRFLDASNTWTTEISHRTKLIFDQLKDFLDRHQLQQQPLIFYYQHINRFVEKLRSLRTSSTSNDPWQNNIEQMWTLLKEYEPRFSSAEAQNIEEQLKCSLESVKPEDLKSQLILLGELETMKTFSCIATIKRYISAGMKQISENCVQQFQLFFDFIRKIDLLLKLIIQNLFHFADQFSKELFEHTPTMIAFFEEIFRSTLKVIEIENDHLHIRVRQKKETFENWQKQLNDYLNQMNFPSIFLKKYHLMQLISNLAALFSENPAINATNHIRRTSSAGKIDLREGRKQVRQHQADKMISNLNEQLSQANRMILRPHHLIEHLHTILQKLRTFDPDDDNETTLKWLQREETRIMTKLKEFEQEIKDYTTLQMNLPQDGEIPSIDKDQLSQKVSSEQTLGHHLKHFVQNINKCEQASQLTDLNHMIRLTHAQVSDQTWLHTINLLGKDPKNEKLSQFLMFFRDDLAMELQDDPTKTDQIILAYSQFRCGLLIEEARQNMLINYETIANLLKSLNEWMKNSQLNVFNLIETIKNIGDNLNRLRSQMRNFRIDAICNVLPIDLRPEDIFSLLIPEYTSHVRLCSEKFDQIGQKLSQRVNQVESIIFPSNDPMTKVHFGLASFQYRDGDDPTKTQAIFDDRKCIRDIANGLTQVITDLLNMCLETSVERGVLMQSASSIKELFPIHLALALILMIFLDQATKNFEDFSEHLSRLGINTLKKEEEELKNLKYLINDREKEIAQINTELNRVKEEQRSAQRDYDNVQYRYMKSTKEQILNECVQRKRGIENKQKAKESELSEVKENFEKKETRYKERREQEQQRWFEILQIIFQDMNKSVQKCLAQFVTDHNDLTTTLKGIVNLSREQLITTNELSVDLNVLETIRNGIVQLLKKLDEHGKSLTDKDPMRCFIHYYIDVMHIALQSLSQSVSNWKIFSEKLRSDSIRVYAEKNHKPLIHQLTNATYDECRRFLNQVRSGFDQNEILKLAQQIGNDVHQKIKSLNILFSGEFSEQMEDLLFDFERFIGNFLVIGCRYSQFQRGNREALHDILINMTNNEIDRDLPRNEIDLRYRTNFSSKKYYFE